jgi:hypothetical protein
MSGGGSMSKGTGPAVSQPKTSTKAPTTITVQVSVPPGGTTTLAVHTHLDIVLRDLETTKATEPALIRVRVTETSDPEVSMIYPAPRTFQDYLAQELPSHLSALVDEERTEWEKKNGHLVQAAGAGDDEAFFTLLARDPRHLTSEQTLRRVLTWRTEIDHYYRYFGFKASQFWTDAVVIDEARRDMEHAKACLRRFGQCQMELSDQRGKRPLPPPGHVRGIYYGLLCVIQGLRELYKKCEKQQLNSAQCEDTLRRLIRGLMTLHGDSPFLTYVTAASHLMSEPLVQKLTGKTSWPLSMLVRGQDLTPSDSARTLTADAFDVSEASVERLCAESAPIPLPSPETERWFLAGRPEFALFDFPEVQALQIALSR